MTRVIRARARVHYSTRVCLLVQAMLSGTSNTRLTCIDSTHGLSAWTHCIGTPHELTASTPVSIRCIDSLHQRLSVRVILARAREPAGDVAGDVGRNVQHEAVCVCMRRFVEVVSGFVVCGFGFFKCFLSCC